MFPFLRGNMGKVGAVFDPNFSQPGETFAQRADETSWQRWFRRGNPDQRETRVFDHVILDSRWSARAPAPVHVSPENW